MRNANDPLLCDACGDNMNNNDSSDSAGFQTVIGVSIHIANIIPNKHPEEKKFINTFGKSDVNVCFTCWAKSMGVKPVKATA